MPEPITPDSLQIARLEEQFSYMRETLERMSGRLDGVDQRMAGVEHSLSEAKGGWRTLMALGGAAATMGSIATWIISHVRLQ